MKVLVNLFILTISCLVTTITYGQTIENLTFSCEENINLLQLYFTGDAPSGLENSNIYLDFPPFDNEGGFGDEDITTASILEECTVGVCNPVFIAGTYYPYKIDADLCNQLVSLDAINVNVIFQDSEGDLRVYEYRSSANPPSTSLLVDCPVSIIRRDGKIALEYSANTNSESIFTDVAFVFDEDEDADEYNGFYQPIASSSSSNVVTYNLIYNEIFMDVTVVFRDGDDIRTCVFKDGSYCDDCPPNLGDSNECVGHLEVCWDDILAYFAEDNLISCEQWAGDCGLNGFIYRTGKVGIGGNGVLDDYSLTVAGSILTEQFKVAIKDRWADYVFAEDYSLLSLPEVAGYIKQNGHLPNTPSAKEIDAKGYIDLAATKINQQEKIEELFLHVIDLQKRVERLRGQIRE